MKTADPELMRAINRFHVVDTIRRFGPISRIEISERTELSPTTVSAITATLLDDGLITPLQMGAVRDAARGRPRVMLELKPDAAFVVGIKLASNQITIATTNFRADVLKSLMLPVRIDRHSPAVIADLVEDGVRRCVSDAGLTMNRIAGVCVGLPGVIERHTGVCRQSPIFGERNIAFALEVQSRLGVAVTLDSDVNLATMAEHWFGHGRELDNFLVVSAEYDLGLGVVHNNEVFRAANGLSADLGDLLVRLPMSDSEGPVRLADVASGAAILARTARLVNEPDLPNRHEEGWRRVRALANGGDRQVISILATAGEAIGFAIANLIALFAPPKVVLAGAVLDLGEPLMGPLRAAIAGLTPASLVGISEIVEHRWGDDLWARGAAAMTLKDLYGAPWNTTGPAMQQHFDRTAKG